jgi:hypothetical protein
VVSRSLIAPLSSAQVGPVSKANALLLAETMTQLGSAPEAVWMIDADGVFTSAHGPALHTDGRPVAPGLRLADCIEGHPHQTRIWEAHHVALQGIAGGYIAQWGAHWHHVHVSPIWDSHGRVAGAFGVAHRTTAEVAAAEGGWGARTEEAIQATFTTYAEYRLASGRVLPAGTDVHFRPGRSSREVVATTVLSAEEAAEVAAPSTSFALTLVQPASLWGSIHETLLSLLPQRRRPPLGLVK